MDQDTQEDLSLLEAGEAEYPLRIKREREGDDTEEPPAKKQKTKKKVSYSQPDGFYLFIGNLEKEAKDVAESLCSQLAEGLLSENKDRAEAGVKELEFKVFEGEQIRVYPSIQEQQIANRLYRRHYRQLPQVVMKRILASKLPEVIEKRKEYSAREDVKLKKKINSSVRRLGLRTLKEMNPSIYQTVMNTASEKFMG